MPTTRSETTYRLEHRFTEESDRVYLTGSQALARVMVDHQRAERRRGARSGGFVSGYPGSPLAGFDKELGRDPSLLKELDIVHQPGVNEELALTAVMGSQLAAGSPAARYDGVAALWYGKAPGLDRAGDALKHGNYVGASAGGGVLVAVGDDPQCKSSSLPSGSEVAFYDALLPILFPGSVQEVLDLGQHGLQLSRASGLWTGFKIVTNVADAAADANVDPHRLSFAKVDRDDAYPIAKPHSHLLPPRSVEMEREIYEMRLPLALEYARVNSLNRIESHRSGDWLGIIASGRAYFDLQQALSDLGLSEQSLERVGIRLLKLSLLYPFDQDLTRRFASGLEEILVLEEKRAFLETFVKDALYGRTDAPRVVGKADEAGTPLVPSHGALDADVIAKVTGARLGQKGSLPSVTSRLAELNSLNNRAPLTLLPARTPYFCSGCPHNRSTKVPNGSLVSAGIGCHGMSLLMTPDQVGDLTGLTQMGGEGAQWIGMAPFVESPHIFQNVGDGTFFHSAHLAVRAAVAAGVTMTFKLLYNGAIAMTGGQEVPGGHRVAEITQLLELEGVKKIIVTTEDQSRYRNVAMSRNSVMWHRDRLEEAQRKLATIPGVTVLIHDQQCAAEKRKLRKRGRLPKPTQRIMINERVCEGCGDCGAKANCLSLQPLETEFGRKTTIHQSSCNIDESCLLGDCPSFVTIETAPRWKRRKRAAPSPQSPPIDLAEPECKVPRDDFALRLVGIGGTGVVTVSQVLGTAAMLEGRHVSGLDQTGLSQKGGPVISDLRITQTAEAGSAKLSALCADTFLAFDILTAASSGSLAVASTERTIAIVSTEQTATGHMVADSSIAFPDVENLKASIDSVTRGADNAYIDVSAVSDALFHSHTFNNVMTLGAAYQAGAIPVRAESIEQALELNGVSVEANLAAFRWGRALVAAPELARVSSGSGGGPASPSIDAHTAKKLDKLGAVGEVRRILAIRIPELIAYQSSGYADRYLEVVSKVMDAERTSFDGGTELTEIVARNLYKLMAYKDEYEVARLHLDSAFKAQISQEFGEARRIRFHLHPPLLRAMGMKRKLRLGSWVRPLFRALVAMRRLRGSPFDPFGYAHVRRVERELIDEYRSAVLATIGNLTAETYANACRLAALPDMIRGYEDIKLENVNKYRSELGELLQTLNIATEQKAIAKSHKQFPWERQL